MVPPPPPSAAAFALGTHSAIRAIRAAAQRMAKATHMTQHPGAEWGETTGIHANLCDLHIVVPTRIVAAVYSATHTIPAKCELIPNKTKTEATNTGITDPTHTHLYTDKLSILGPTPTQVRTAQEAANGQKPIAGTPIQLPAQECPILAPHVRFIAAPRRLWGRSLLTTHETMPHLRPPTRPTPATHKISPTLTYKKSTEPYRRQTQCVDHLATYSNQCSTQCNSSAQGKDLGLLHQEMNTGSHDYAPPSTSLP